MKTVIVKYNGVGEVILKGWWYGTLGVPLKKRGGGGEVQASINRFQRRVTP
jgi:hypothetical protein